MNPALFAILLLISASAFGAPNYDDLTPDQLDQYARARDHQYSHDQAMDYASKPIPKTLDDLTPQQRDDYDTVHGHGGLRHEDAWRHATSPPPPPSPPLSVADNTPAPMIDAEQNANHAAAEDARRRAATLRGESPAGTVGSGEGSCGYDIPGVLAQLEQFPANADGTAARSALWNSLPADVQRQVLNLQAVRDASEAQWLAESGLEAGDLGVVWSAEVAALMNTVTGGGAVKQSLVARGQDYYGPVIADLEAKQQQIGTALAQAYRDQQTYTRDVQTYQQTAGQQLGDDGDRETFLEGALAATATKIATLTGDYELVTTQLENTRRAASSYQNVAALADTKANAAALAAEAERRFQLAFTASQALRQQNAQLMTGRIAFSDAKAALQTKIDQARSDGRDSSADQWVIDLQYLTAVEDGWLTMNTRIAAGLQNDRDNLLAQNAADGIGPRDPIQLANTIQQHGMYPTVDPERLQQVQARIAVFAGGVQNNREYQFGWRDAFLLYSDTVDDAFVAPWELATHPIDSIKGNLRFWRNYGSFWYGVGRAAKDGVVDIFVLTTEALDTVFEVDQAVFNVTFGTDIKWFGDENLQFIAQIGDLTPDKASAIADEITNAINRRIEQNAGSGNVNQMLEDTGYVVGTVAGAEEGAIRAVVITTRYGKVLIKGKQVEKLLDSAADANRAGDAAVAAARVDDLSNAAKAGEKGLSSNPFDAIPPTVSPGRIPATVGPGQPVNVAPSVAGPGLINPRGGTGRMTAAKDGTLVVRFNGHSVVLQPKNLLGKGSTSRVYPSPRAPNFIIKITDARGAAGLPLDNYGYRLLENAAQNGKIDPTKLHFPKVVEQFPVEGGGVVTIAEKGPLTVHALTNGGKLTEPMVQAIQDGVEELARNGMIFPDFKLDNIGLIDVGNGKYRMSILDPGSLMLADSPATARKFFSAVLSPPPEAIHAVDTIAPRVYMNNVTRMGSNLGNTAAEIQEAQDLINKALQSGPTFFTQPWFPNTRGGKLAAKAFGWTRIDGFKSWLAGTFDTSLEFAHFQQGTGIKLNSLGPGGLVYNPSAGRQSLELGAAFGSAGGGIELQGAGALAGSGPSPFRLGSDLSGASSSGPGKPLLPGWNAPMRAGATGSGAPVMVEMPYRFADDVLNNIELKPFIERRFLIGGTRLLRFDCDTPYVVQMSLSPAQRNQVAQLPGVTLEDDVARAEQTVRIDDPLYPQQTALQAVGLSEDRLIDIAKHKPANKGVVVAVIDSGVAWGHRDLDVRAMWMNKKEIPANGFDDDGNGYVDDIVGWNFIDNNNLPWDTDGHGTMIAGIIAARSGNGIGIAGINPHARIMALRALDSLGKGRASHTAEAIVYAVNNGAQLINLSLGGRGMTRAETHAIEFANERGVLVVAAAGNEAIELTDWGPATAPGVLAVGATDAANERMRISNWGKRVDLMAPGVDVVSLRSPGTDLMMKFESEAPLKHVVGSDHAYYRASGTSFAAPIVTGIASLIKQQNPAATPGEIRRMLTNSARDIGPPGTEVATGDGLLDAPAALAADPNVFIRATLDGVRVGKSGDGQVLDVLGIADAERPAQATLWLGKGKDPSSWQQVAALTTPARGVLAQIPSGEFTGTPQWTLRLVVKNGNGLEREARFALDLQ